MTRTWSWWPILLIAVGVILLAQNLGMDVSLLKFWPVLIILLGVTMLIPRQRRRVDVTMTPPPPAPPQPPADDDASHSAG